jgi:hypothetical protein
MAPEESARPATLPLSRATFPQENDDAVFPNAGNAKQLRKIYQILFTAIHLCLSLYKFQVIKFHDMLKHPRPYPDTRGLLLGLRSTI